MTSSWDRGHEVMHSAKGRAALFTAHSPIAAFPCRSPRRPRGNRDSWSRFPASPANNSPPHDLRLHQPDDKTYDVTTRSKIRRYRQENSAPLPAQTGYHKQISEGIESDCSSLTTFRREPTSLDRAPTEPRRARKSDHEPRRVRGLSWMAQPDRLDLGVVSSSFSLLAGKRRLRDKERKRCCVRCVPQLGKIPCFRLADGCSSSERDGSRG